jgi:uncharacterized protein YbjT (DUF2867 family)
VHVAVAGASGFVGRRLVPRLMAGGHDVVALGRRPADLARALPGATAVAADVTDPLSLRLALDGVEAAYYLVHLLGQDDLVGREVTAARRFGLAARDAGVRQVVYLGGLVPPELAVERLSAHLRARRLTEDALGVAGVPVTSLRAAIVLGRGSAGWELVRQLVTALPVLASPARSRSRSQPIAAADLVDLLVAVLGHAPALGAVVEVGGPDVVTYPDLVRRTARALHRPGLVPRVPWLPTVLQDAAVRGLTDVDPALASDLLESLRHDAVVGDPRWLGLLGRPLLGLDDAIAAALAEDPAGAP